MSGLLKLDVQVTMGQVKSLLEVLDHDHSGEVDLAELDDAIKQYKKHKSAGHVEDLIKDQSNEPLDSVFPNWLITRRDFQLVFTRFQDGGVNEGEQVIKSFRVDRENRTHEDLQRISTWMEKREILPGLGTRRFMDLSKTVHFLEVEKGFKLCNQGDMGDAFYIIYSGSIRVIIDGKVVGELLPGNGFGERSLETDEPRSATCIASERSQCVVIKSHEYKLMMKMHQAKKFKQAMSFLQVQCKVLRSWTYPKIFRLSSTLIRRVFNPGDVLAKQGEESTVMYLLYKGKVSIRKEVTYTSENRWPDRNREYTVVTHEKMVALHLKDLQAGDHFGEEMVFGYDTRQYSAVAAERSEVFVMNKGDVLNFFKGNQIVEDMRNETQILYESADEVKARHDLRVRMEATYRDIKKAAFGNKYKNRAGLNKKKKLKRKTTGKLEETLRRLNMAQFEKSVSGNDSDVHEIGAEDAKSAASKSVTGETVGSVPSASALKLPVLREKVSVRRESQKERQSSLRASVSLPSLGLSEKDPDSFDAIDRIRRKHQNKREEDEKMSKKPRRARSTVHMARKNARLQRSSIHTRNSTSSLSGNIENLVESLTNSDV